METAADTAQLEDSDQTVKENERWGTTAQDTQDLPYLKQALRVSANSYMVMFQSDENVLKLIMVMVT